jgi:hypothetical protein
MAAHPPPRVAQLARVLRVGLNAHGVCPACLGMVAMELEHGDERSAWRTVRWVAVTLWAEGLGEPVEVALRQAVRRDVRDAREALRDFEARGPRSEIFRAVVHRLALQLEEEVRRSYLASLN